MKRTMNTAELKSAIGEGQRFQLIDVREASEFAEGHIPGAINIPMAQVETRFADLHQSDTLVLICQSGKRAEMTCNLLAPHRNDLILLEGGTSAWINAGFPVIGASSKRLPLMRQVQLVAGLLILTGSILAVAIDPRWVFLSAFVGAGFTLAGSTGWCGMALLLGKMPWNKPKSIPTVAVKPMA